MAGRRDKCRTCKWFGRDQLDDRMRIDPAQRYDRFEGHGWCHFLTVDQQGPTNEKGWCSNHEEDTDPNPRPTRNPDP